MSNSPRPPSAPAIESLYVAVGEGCSPVDYAGKTPVTGKIALIKRGTCTFTAKALLAQTQGASAALIYNNVAGDFSGSMEKMNIPVAGISDTNGAYLVGFTDATTGLSTHTVLLDPNATVLAGRVTGFSSRGPTGDYRIKPDVVAPGNTVTSSTSKVGIPTQSMADPSGYTTAGGTSMATPHVAGAAAILRQAHPGWTPFDVRLALMNTARQLIDPADGKPYSVQDQGAGLIDVLGAVNTKGLLAVKRPDLGAVATEGSYSFGQVENIGGTITFFAFQGPSQTDTLTLAKPVTIPAGASAMVNYATYYDTEPTFDFGYLQASRDGKAWTVIDRVDGLSTGWAKRQADLSSFAGGAAYIRFRYASDSIFDLGLYEGWYVDDVSVSTADWKTIAEPTATSR